jgi:hypothetical protein
MTIILCVRAKSRKEDCVCQLLFSAEIVPTFIFGRILPKTLFTAKNIEPSMNATSSRVPTAKSGFGCQKKSLALWLPKKKFGMIPAKNKNRHDCA